MSNPTRIGQEAPDLKTPSSPSRITPTRALDDDAEKQMTKPPEPKYPYAVDEAGVARVGYVAVDPAQHNKATELQLWPLFSAFLTLGINIKGAGSLFRNDMDSTIERRARGDDDDESFHTASALTPSSIIMASLPA